MIVWELLLLGVAFAGDQRNDLLKIDSSPMHLAEEGRCQGCYQPGCVEISTTGLFGNFEKACSCPGASCPGCCLYGCNEGVWVCHVDGACPPRAKTCPAYDPCSWTGVPTPELFALALHPNNIGDPLSGKLCKITEGGPSTACNYYVKYSIDNGASWLGLTFSGTPGGTGCPNGGVGASGTSSLAVDWLKSEYIDEGYCGCQDPCGWTAVPTPELFALALHPNNIGDPSSGKLCKITEGGPSTACNYYVKYSIDNGGSWLGLTFSGTPGGTGCPNGGVGASGTSSLAVNWLKTKYIDEGYCGCQDPCGWTAVPTPELFSLAIHPNNIGDPLSGKLCKITEGGPSTACNYYVKYSIDNGGSWLGLTFSGTPGGTGCPNGGVGASGTSSLAVNWLKTQYIDEGYCGCQDPCGWTAVPTPELFSLAIHPNNIGDPLSGKLCKITEGGPSTACNFYVKYSIDNGGSWLGLTFSGTPGGTGCPSGGVGASGTSSLAVQWLKTKYIDEGYCGCLEHTCRTGAGSSCKTCLRPEDRTAENQCASCNPGYFLHETSCYGYICIVGAGDQCQSCMPQNLRTDDDQCLSCNSGYKLTRESKCERVCCTAFSSTCLACQLGLTEEQYCKNSGSYDVPGCSAWCPKVRGCPPCTDDNRSCPRWAAYCWNTWVQTTCKLTCRTC